MRILVAPTVYIVEQPQMDWLAKTMRSFRFSTIEFDKIGFVNYLNPKYKNVVRSIFGELIYNDQNNLSASWNRAIEYGFAKGYDYVVIPNLDILLEEKTLENLVNFAESKKDAVMFSGFCTNREKDIKPDCDYVVKATGLSNYDSYAFFMVNKNLFQRVGKFDSHYKVYCEDVDMEHRINLAGQEHWVVRDAEFYHHENITLNGMDRTLGNKLREENNGALNHFVRKWGDIPRKQVYKHPFNNKNLDFTYTGDKQ